MEKLLQQSNRSDFLAFDTALVMQCLCDEHGAFLQSGIS